MYIGRLYQGPKSNSLADFSSTFTKWSVVYLLKSRGLTLLKIMYKISKSILTELDFMISDQISVI